MRYICDAPSGRSWLKPERTQRSFRASVTSGFHIIRLRIKFRQELRRRGSQLRDLIVPWAFLTLGAPTGPVSFRMAGADARTTWGAALLERNLGWQLVPREAAAAPAVPSLSLREMPWLGARQP